MTEPVEPPPAFSVAGAADLPGRWWTVFDAPGLDAAVETALAANLELMAAWERLRAARAVTDRAAAQRLPFVDAGASAGVTRPTGAGDSRQSLVLDLAASYEVDLWGRIDAQVDAERFRAEATREDYRTAALSLSAEVARAWVELAEAATQVQLVEDQIQTNLTVLGLLENRFGTGLVQGVDLIRQRQLIEATREQRAVALETRQLVEHRLAVLLGRAPQQGPDVQPADLPVLPPLPDAGVPLELIRRRPDVRSAFLRLRAADEEVAVAVSRQFPRLSLSASIATEGGAADDLFQDWIRALGGSLLAPLFYGGELRAEVDRTRAVRQQRLYEYGQATLRAFREVEDALASEVRQRERLAQIEAQVTLAEQALERLQTQYLNGTTDYLDVLTALEEIQVLSRDRLAARSRLVDVRISLYRAVAGSFETPREAE
ncbi:MAG: efflux transporter outer membrane subunit [Gemmatimonadota bacterium]